MYHKMRIFVHLLIYLYVYPSIITHIIVCVTNDIQIQFLSFKLNQNGGVHR